jgi:hypothetical protein
MSSTITLPTCKQLCNRYCSNKHTHTDNIAKNSYLKNLVRFQQQQAESRQKSGSVAVPQSPVSIWDSLPLCRIRGKICRISRVHVGQMPGNNPPPQERAEDKRREEHQRDERPQDVRTREEEVAIE